MEPSPLAQLLAAIDRLDPAAITGLCTADCRFATVDGRVAEGVDQIGELLTDFLGVLRSTQHQLTSEWHVDDVWIAEVLASYELADWMRLERLPRVFVVRTAPGGLRDVRVYGARERPLSDESEGGMGARSGGRPVLPL